MVKHLPAIQETWVRSLGWEEPLEKEMATHSSILAGKSRGQRTLVKLQLMGSQRVGHDWATSLSFFLSFLVSLEITMHLTINDILNLIKYETQTQWRSSKKISLNTKYYVWIYSLIPRSPRRNWFHQFTTNGIKEKKYYIKSYIHLTKKQAQRMSKISHTWKCQV